MNYIFIIGTGNMREGFFHKKRQPSAGIDVSCLFYYFQSFYKIL